MTRRKQHKPTQGSANRPSPKASQPRDQSPAQQGPLPPASELERYEQTLPGSAKTIVLWAEEETRFRHRMLETDAAHQRRMDWADETRSYIGLLFGATIAMVGLLGSFNLAFSGYQIAAAVIGAIDIASIAGIFVYGTSQAQNAKNRNER